MTITEKQTEEFKEEREKLLHDFYIFEEGINFSERYTEVEVRRKQWIEIVCNRINSLKIEELRKMNADEYGYVISDYISSIEKAILMEFSRVIPPFDLIIHSYKEKIRNIFIKSK